MPTLIADFGDLLRYHPRYNAVTVLDVLQAHSAEPTKRHLHILSPWGAEHPLRFVLAAAGWTWTEYHPDWAWAEAEALQLRDILQQYPQARLRLQQVQALEQQLEAAVLAPLDAETVHSTEFLGQLQDIHGQLQTVLEEGPGTAHRLRRIELLATQLASLDGLVLVAVDDLQPLLDACPQAGLPSQFPLSEPARLRALVDRAYRLEDNDDIERLVQQLLTETGDIFTPQAELHYAAANIYLACGDLESARGLLEQAGHAQIEHPQYLFGLVYARLGQVRDALADREGALRAYKATLALNWAPDIARETAQLGLEQPFAIDLGNTIQ